MGKVERDGHARRFGGASVSLKVTLRSRASGSSSHRRSPAWNRSTGCSRCSHRAIRKCPRGGEHGAVVPACQQPDSILAGGEDRQPRSRGGIVAKFSPKSRGFDLRGGHLLHREICKAHPARATDEEVALLAEIRCSSALTVAEESAWKVWPSQCRHISNIARLPVASQVSRIRCVPLPTAEVPCPISRSLAVMVTIPPAKSLGARRQKRAGAVEGSLNRRQRSCPVPARNKRSPSRRRPSRSRSLPLENSTLQSPLA